MFIWVRFVVCVYVFGYWWGSAVVYNLDISLNNESLAYR